MTNIECLDGVPGQSRKVRGSLRISPTAIIFLIKGKPQFLIDAHSVDYVAAQAKASLRTRTADVGRAVVSNMTRAGAPLAFPLAFLFHKREKHLLSIEYLEGEQQVRRLALFDVHDHSALAVKKCWTTGCGLRRSTTGSKDAQEEECRRNLEAATSPAG